MNKHKVLTVLSLIFIFPIAVSYYLTRDAYCMDRKYGGKRK